MSENTTIENPSGTKSASEAGSVECPLCDATGKITNPDHPDHWSKTLDGEGQDWCLACDEGHLSVVDGVIFGDSRYVGESVESLKAQRAIDGEPND